MGKKSGQAPAPPPVDETAPMMDQNFDAMINMMNQMMALQTQMAMNPPAPPPLPPMPVIDSGPSIDWTERNKQLASKAKADFHVDAARKKGRSATILTSPLLDDEEPETTSIIVG